MSGSFVVHEPPCPPLDYARHPRGEATTDNCCAARRNGFSCTILKTVPHTRHEAGGCHSHPWVIASWEDD